MIFDNMKQSMERFFGTEPFKMVRKDDPETSMDAAEKVDSTTLERQVYEVIAKHPDGCIAEEVMSHFPNHGIQTISPRFAPLLRKGLIEDTGKRRKAFTGHSQRVLKAIK